MKNQIIKKGDTFQFPDVFGGNMNTWVVCWINGSEAMLYCESKDSFREVYTATLRVLRLTK